MFADDRLIRLRALVAELERLPASPKTEWMLAEARARMVDVETGERPRALRPLTGNPPDGDPGRSATETADASPVKRPARQRAKPARDVPARPPSAVTASGKGEAPPRPAAAPATGDASADSGLDAMAFEGDGLLSLEDSPTHDSADGEGGSQAQPWRRGLRG